MSKYWVKYTRYVTEQEEVTIAVEAKDEAEALQKAKTGDGEEVNWDTWDRSVEDEYWDEAEVMTEKDMRFTETEDFEPSDDKRFDNADGVVYDNE